MAAVPGDNHMPTQSPYIIKCNQQHNTFPNLDCQGPQEHYWAWREGFWYLEWDPDVMFNVFLGMQNDGEQHVLRGKTMNLIYAALEAEADSLCTYCKSTLYLP